MQGAHLVGVGTELQAARVDPVLEDHGMDLLLGGLGHPAAGVRHDHDPLDAQQVGGEHEGAQDVLGDSGAGVAQDLRVAGREPEHPQRVDPGVHAGQDRQAAGC